MQETILCAAIWYKNIPIKNEFSVNMRPINCDVGLVFCGHRHGNCIFTMFASTGMRSVESEVGEYVQGFLTNKNRFVDRKEAGQIAFDAGQISSQTNCLFSEDLY